MRDAPGTTHRDRVKGQYSAGNEGRVDPAPPIGGRGRAQTRRGCRGRALRYRPPFGIDTAVWKVVSKPSTAWAKAAWISTGSALRRIKL